MRLFSFSRAYGNLLPELTDKTVHERWKKKKIDFTAILVHNALVQETFSEHNANIHQRAHLQKRKYFPSVYNTFEGCIRLIYMSLY